MSQLRLALLWVILVICMILHFDYHVSEIFYGINIVKPGANGKIPPTIVLIRTAFHFLPIIYAVCLLWWSGRAVRVINLILSIVYTIANTAHFGGELKKGDNPSQISLLGLTFAISVVLVIAARQWLKDKSVQPAVSSTDNA